MLDEPQKRTRNTHTFEREPADHYVEPQWVSERLFEILDLPAGTAVWDPACGFGRIVRAAAARGHDVLGTDIETRWTETPDGPHHADARFHRLNFLGDDSTTRTDVIVSNPPFARAQDFADVALQRSRRLVALLLPTKWLNGAERAEWRQRTPLYLVMPINPRPSMPPGHVLLAGQKAGGGTVDFSWFVWLHGYRGRPMVEDCLRDAGKAVAA